MPRPRHPGSSACQARAVSFSSSSATRNASSRRLHVVQARVAQRLVARRERGLVDLLRAAEALGDVVAGELDVDAAGEGADGAVRLEEAAHLVDDVVEATRLVAGGRRDAVAVHRVGDPQRGGARVAHGLEQRRQRVADLARAHARDEREPAGLAVRVELVDQLERRLGRRRRAELHADGVADLREVVDVRAVEVARALADPQEVRRRVVRRAGARVDARHRPLVVHEQALVAGVELDALAARRSRRRPPP